MLTDAPLAQYGIVTLLSPEATSYAETLWDAVEAKFGLTGRTKIPWPPHVTLKYHFSTHDVEPVQAAMAEFAQTEPVIPWAIEGFSSFRDGDARVIFMEVRPNAALRALHDRLLSRLRTFDWMAWGAYDGPELHYHATIAYRGLTPDNFDEVWQFLTNRKQPRFDLLLDNVTLVEIEHDSEAAIVRRRFDLTGATP